MPIQVEVLSDDRSGRTRRRQLLYKITWLHMVLRGSAEDRSACEGFGDEVHLYVVPATNLSLATVGRAKRSQKQMRLELIVAAKS